MKIWDNQKLKSWSDVLDNVVEGDLVLDALGVEFICTVKLKDFVELSYTKNDKTAHKGMKPKYYIYVESFDIKQWIRS